MDKIYKLIFPFLFVSVLFACGGQKNTKQVNEEVNNGTADITFTKLEHDFGTIDEGEIVACVFKFENTGDGDLLISSATTSCGCTVPRFDNEPVRPGETGTIEVVFDSSYREGKQSKTITIRSNARVKVLVLRIIAEVINNK